MAQNNTNSNPGSGWVARINEEIHEYETIMKQIEDKMIPNLEGMRYGKSPAEQDFKVYATMGLVIIFFFFIAHQVFRYMRNKHLEWKPNVNASTIPDGIRLPLNLIEREIAPSLLVVTFCVSVGAFYFFQLLLTILVAGCSLFLFSAYK